MKPHGWFGIPGVQTGERTLPEQVLGLGFLLTQAPGARVLDAGCAEGLIGKWLLDHGAASVHGLEGYAPYIETGRALFGNAIRFDHVDLNDIDTWSQLLDERYDIVLALNILHKLSDPERALRALAAHTGKLLALSLPEDVICDVRSGFAVVNPVTVLGEAFERVSAADAERHPKKGFYGRRTVFRRRP